MNKSLAILLLSVVVLFSSCTRLLLKVTGNYIRPRNEDSTSVLTYCRKHNVYYDRVLVVKDKASFAQLTKRHGSIPSINIFNSSKQLVISDNGANCPWRALNLLSKDTVLAPVEQSDSSYTFIRDLTRSIAGKPDGNYDYYLVAGWAIFTPKLTKSMFEVVNELHRNAAKRVCFILLNEDMQQGWKQ